ncbi:MAG: hypothetical protein HFJ03_03720 [Lachnospira sp.]|jgi:hypothetical protein|nr:hypothetical protein [Lachnospira sp.]
MSNNREDEGRPEIKINKKMRTWNKYRNYCFIAAGVIVVILAVFIVVNMVTKDKDNSDVANRTTSHNNTVSQTKEDSSNTQATTQPEPTKEQTTTQQTTTKAQQTGGTLKVSGSAEEQEFVGADKFKDCVFFGDFIISGISFYGFLPESQVVSDDNATSDKLQSQVDSALSSNPSKVFIMVGLNDANYGTRDGKTIAGFIGDTVKEIKSKSASTSVYILSVLPVTSAFENRPNISIKQSLLDEINESLSNNAAEYGATFIDLAGAYKDGSGYLRTECTSNGSNIVGGYYPFMLNSISKLING